MTVSDTNVTSKNPELVSHLKDDRDDIMHYGSWLKRRYAILNACDVENDKWMLTVCSICIILFN